MTVAESREPRAASREPKPESPLWDGLTAEALASRCGVPHVTLLDETDSTQDVAHVAAEQGAPAGTVVLADAQRAGRGRLGRDWVSRAGHGVWCSVVEQPGDITGLGVLSLRVGLGVAEGLDRFAAEPVRIKWPNDLVVGGGKVGGKVGGILVEARWNGGRPAWVAIGIGVNVAAPTDVPGAAGLRAGTSRAHVLAVVVEAARAAAARDGHLSADELGRFGSRDALRGRRIVEPIAGRVEGIAPSGDLLVRGPRGSERVRAGTIRLAEDP